ncbi:hypothetical protein DWD20_19565 [Salmonella enterica]|nr:hypothetical protein [Salmonella enterica]EBX0544864.1 hypothetical protein [Salmonella enterica subsp. houtenae serovar 44:z4,z23:-]ECE5931662.1 hypothetical protein [Salmonella enterica subsp. houtenae]EBJ5245886.1 hypothetical protein [Salmonella enterica]EBK4177725.1 hypothetical protein [Salmonella enterica]
MLTHDIKYCINVIAPGVYPDFHYGLWRVLIPAILNSVSCDTRSSGAHLEQVTFQRIGFGL